MLKILPLTTLHKAIKDLVEEKTGLPCFDEVPEDKPSPFYILEIVGKENSNTKTMYRDIYSIYVHAISSSKQKGSVAIYQLLQGLEEALSVEIELPEPFHLVNQINRGIENIREDETGEKHGILAVDFYVSYGYIAK